MLMCPETFMNGISNESPIYELSFGMRMNAVGRELQAF